MYNVCRVTHTLTHTPALFVLMSLFYDSLALACVYQCLLRLLGNRHSEWSQHPSCTHAAGLTVRCFLFNYSFNNTWIGVYTETWILQFIRKIHISWPHVEQIAKFLHSVTNKSQRKMDFSPIFVGLHSWHLLFYIYFTDLSCCMQRTADILRFSGGGCDHSGSAGMWRLI